MSNRTAIIPLILALSTGAAWAQESAQDVLRQLLPSDGAAPARQDISVAPVADEIGRDALVTRLSRAELVRSFGNAPSRLVLGAGLERAAMNSLQAYPSADLSLSFEPNSDLLTPAGIGRLDVLGEALKDGALARSGIVIGVYTNAPGSDEFNKGLAELRARSVVEQLATRRGVPRSRLYAVGFGRVDPSAAAVHGEAIKVVNIGTTAVQWVGSADRAARTVEEPVAPKKAAGLGERAAPRAKVHRKLATAKRQQAPAVVVVRRTRALPVVAVQAPPPPPKTDGGFFSFFTRTGNSGSGSVGVGGIQSSNTASASIDGGRATASPPAGASPSPSTGWGGGGTGGGKNKSGGPSGSGGTSGSTGGTSGSTGGTSGSTGGTTGSTGGASGSTGGTTGGTGGTTGGTGCTGGTAGGTGGTSGSTGGTTGAGGGNTGGGWK